MNPTGPYDRALAQLIELGKFVGITEPVMARALAGIYVSEPPAHSWVLEREMKISGPREWLDGHNGRY